MKYEELFTYIGEMGRYQWMAYVAVFILTIYTCDSIHIVFAAGPMEHWCRVEQLLGLPYDVQKNVAIPTEDGSGGVKYSSCSMYALNYSSYNESQFVNWNRSEMITDNTPVISCQQWTYDQSTFTSTIVSKFNLVCGWDFLTQLASTAYMGGVLAAGLTSGAMSDRFGRKKTMLLFSFGKITGILMVLFGGYYTVFMIGRFLIGFGQAGYFLSGYVLVAELVGTRYRTALGCGLQVAFSIGFMIQPAIAYRLRDEFSYQLATLAPNFLVPFVIIFLPESPRWLMLRGRYDVLLSLLKRICRINGRPLPADFDPKSIEQTQTIKSKNCFALVTSRVMRLRTFVIYLSWLTCSLIYYALSLNIDKLHGSIYVNTFISGAVEIPAYILSTFMMDWKFLGRRGTGCLSLILAGLSSFLCIPMLICQYHRASTVFAMFGKAFVCVTYGVIYVFGAEIFPTEVRNVGMGTGSMCSRFSAMIAAFVGGPLAVVWKPLPSLIFGILATVSGFCYLLMPETLREVLPDTIEEAEKFQRQKIKWPLRLLPVNEVQYEENDDVDCTSKNGGHELRLRSRDKEADDSKTDPDVDRLHDVQCESGDGGVSQTRSARI